MCAAVLVVLMGMVRAGAIAGAQDANAPSDTTAARPGEAAEAPVDTLTAPEEAAEESDESVEEPDESTEAPVDTIAVAPRKGGVTPVASPPDRPPWTMLAAPGDTLVLSRNEVERTGAHFPLEILGQVPGATALEASGIAPEGALSLSGSYASSEITSDGWLVRLPRLEGRDLSRLLLDRLGPGVTLIPLAAPGELRLSSDAGSGFASPAIRFTPTEPLADSSRSRVAIYNGGTLTGGGLLFSDRRGRVGYNFGVDNTGSGSSGGVSDVSTRLAMIDARVATSWGRMSVSLRGGKEATDWRNGRRTKHDDQGAAVEIVSGSSLDPAWSLRFHALDDRLSGSEFPDREFKRKQGGIEARWWPRTLRPLWLHVVGERDWIAVRHPGGAFSPRVLRGRFESGGEVGLASVLRLHFLGSLVAGDRHAARLGGRIAAEGKLSPTIGVGVGASRVHRPPTLDQEVLAVGPPPAEPEGQDAAEVWLTRRAPLGLGVLVARRRLVHQPVIVGENSEEPWPQFEFETSSRNLWEVRSLVSTPSGPLGLAAGLWGSRFFAAGDSLSLLTFVPETVGRAFVTMRFTVLGGDLEVRPRVEAMMIGEFHDFAAQRVGGHGRLDATVVGIIGKQVDLELRVRNVLDRRYPLAIVDPVTDQLLLDTGRLILFGLRWRLIG